jgi:hypothetical protein
MVFWAQFDPTHLTGIKESMSDIEELKGGISFTLSFIIQI